jgi:hypothetical protein
MAKETAGQRMVRETDRQIANGSPANNQGSQSVYSQRITKASARGIGQQIAERIATEYNRRINNGLLSKLPNESASISSVEGIDSNKCKLIHRKKTGLPRASCRRPDRQASPWEQINPRQSSVEILP